MRFALFAAVVLCCATTALYGQATTAIISGTVADPTGAVIPGAKVTVVNLQTNIQRDAVSGPGGEFSVRFLPIGSYRVEVDANGFKRFVQSPVVLELNREARVSAVLEIGAVTDTVSVNEDAPAVNTTDASIGRTVDNAEIVTLPLVNRNVYSLLTITPGVDNTETQNTLGMPEQHTLINGSNDGTVGSVAYYLDGGSNSTGLRNTGNVLPNPDAVEQFRVITNGFGAEFGRFTAGVVDVVTKSGTNNYHGSLFEFLRNDKLNAYTWGALTKAPLRRNQFGGAFGGPIVRDRTFFFGSYSGLRERKQVFKNTAIVPTALERAGDFSASRVIPLDPDTRTAFPGGRIPTARLDPTARNILADIPLANVPGNFFQSQRPNPNDTNEYLAKVDHRVNDAHQLTLSYFTTADKRIVPYIGNGNLPWSDQTFDARQHNANVNETWVATPNMVNQFHLTYVRNFGGRLNQPGKSLADYGSQFRPQGKPSLPQITVTGYFTLSEAIDGPVAGSNYYGLRDIFSYNRGRHSMRMGAEVSLEKFIHDTLLNNYGTFNFDGNRSNNALADFLLGLPRTMNQDAPVTKIDNGWYSGFFFQDDWRIHPRVTLNLGLRYEVQPPTTDPHDRKLTFVPGGRSQVVPAAIPGLLFPGDPGITRGIVPTDRNNFAPRFGIAWDPRGDGRTSIRAGAGIFYGSISGNEWNATNDRQPFAVRQQFNNVKSLTEPYANLPGGVSPFPYSYDPKNPRFITPASVGGPALEYVWHYSYQLNFSVQRQIRQDLTVTAAYVSTLAHHLPFTVDANYPFFTPTATAANVDQRRPYQTGQLSSILITRSIMNTAYHGLQLSTEKRMSRNISFKGFYTFSKGLESAQLQNNSTDGGSQDARNLSLERGRSTNDRKHNFVIAAIWEANYFGSMPLAARAILGGWSVSTIASLRSGSPFNVTSGRDNNFDGNTNDRPDLIGNPFLDPNRSRNDVSNAWFNTQAFRQNATGQVGTFGRNVLDGPGLRNIDIGLFRMFRIREGMDLQFRAEMTNALNLVSLGPSNGAPNGTLTSPAFGTVRTARDMRQTQLGLRLSF